MTGWFFKGTLQWYLVGAASAYEAKTLLQTADGIVAQLTPEPIPAAVSDFLELKAGTIIFAKVLSEGLGY